MLNTDELCEHLMRLLHVAIRKYDMNGVLTGVFGDKEEQPDPLVQDSIFLTKLFSLAHPEHPTLYCELDMVLYAILQTPADGIIILGPNALSSNNKTLTHMFATQHGLNDQSLYRLPYNPLETFCEAVGMLFHHCTGQKFSWQQMIMTEAPAQGQVCSLLKKVEEVCYTFQEYGRLHNPYSQERWEQDSIRCGDVTALKRSFQETYAGKVGLLSHDPTRQARNIAIVLITLSTRSAIEGGVPSEIAFSLSDAFIQHIEDLTQPTQIYSAIRRMEIQLAEMVRDQQKNTKQSALTIRCKKEILPRLHQKITVKELAQILHVTPDYLSHVFSKEEGIPLLDYIAKEKIRHAQWRLTFTHDSYQSIAYAYGFSDQSHFGKVFKKITGATPRQYRERTQEEFSNMNTNDIPSLEQS